jgi:hypothetical protein
MRTVVAWPVATVFLLAPLAPAAAAPPTDVAAYCRAAYPQLPVQARCVNVENAAAARVARTAAAIDRTVFDECLGVSPSWTAMESCLAQSAYGESSDRAPGATPPLGASVQPRPDPGAAGRESAPEQNRPARPISEADAERHLRGILERVGIPTAQCTKKQYGPGWVSICQ